MLGDKGSLVSEVLNWNTMGKSPEIRLFMHLNPHLSHAVLRESTLSSLWGIWWEHRWGKWERGEKNSSEFVKGFMFRWDVAEADCGVNVELVQWGEGWAMWLCDLVIMFEVAVKCQAFRKPQPGSPEGRGLEGRDFQTKPIWMCM